MRLCYYTTDTSLRSGGRLSRGDYSADLTSVTLTILEIYNISRNILHITASAVLLVALKLCTSGNWCHLGTTRCWNLPQRDKAVAAGGARQRRGFAADVWSVAASILYIFTATAPYSGFSQVIAALTAERLPPSVKSVPAAQRELLMRCFAVVPPESRPQISEIVHQPQVRRWYMLPSNIRRAWNNTLFVLDTGNVVYCWWLRCCSVHSHL